MKLSEKILKYAEIEIRGSWNYSLNGVTIDSRKVKEGCTFWALQTGSRDAHDFVFEAFAKGAAVVAVTRQWADKNAPKLEGKTLLVMEDTFQGLQNLAMHVRASLGSIFIGITGSAGKTTTREMTVAALSEDGKVGSSPGNFNNHLGVPLTILNLDGDEKFVVIEMGANHVGEIQVLCTIAQPDIGVITNIGEAHLGEFGGIENVRLAKAELFEYLADNGLAVVNLDDERILASVKDESRQTGYTLKPIGSLQLPGYKWSVYMGVIKGVDQWSRPTMEIEGEELQLKLNGSFFAYAAMAAYTVAIEAGVEAQAAIEGLAKVQPVEGRGNLIELKDDIYLVNDCYNANVPSIEAALGTLLNRPGNRIAVLGDVFELGEYAEEEHRRIGRFPGLEEINKVYFVGQNMLWAAEEAEFNNVWCERYDSDGIENLIEQIIEEAEPNTTILVKGSRAMHLEKVVNGLRDALGISRGGDV